MQVVSKENKTDFRQKFYRCEPDWLRYVQEYGKVGLKWYNFEYTDLGRRKKNRK